MTTENKYKILKHRETGINIYILLPRTKGHTHFDL